MDGGRQERSTVGQEDEQKYIPAWGREQEEPIECPETKDGRAFQDPMGMILDKMPQSCEKEPVESTSHRYTWTPVDGPPTHLKIF